MKFKSKISIANWLTIFLLEIILLLPFFFEGYNIFDFKTSGIIIYWIINISCISFFLWIFFNTYYIINNEIMFFKSGPFFGKRKIAEIRKVTYHNKFIVPTTYKPATNHIGLIILFTDYNELFISPIDRDEFVKELLKTNPEIQVIQ